MKIFTWSVVYNSVRYQVIPRFANSRLIACWMVVVELLARIIADVESGNIKRQNRDDSTGDIREFSYKKNKQSIAF